MTTMAVIGARGEVLGSVDVDAKRGSRVFIAHSVLATGATVNRRAARISSAARTLRAAELTGRRWHVAGDVGRVVVLCEGAS